MSETAFQSIEEALKAQHTRNEARRIRYRVEEARKQPHSAGLRWPFELLQNALDVGPRDSRSCISINLHRNGSSAMFEHDGAPFTSQELAALLSGGSSKEFESETTTGRFGTGFLVTHVLAERATLRALLKVPSGCEEFNLILDRGGDEDAILQNMQDCNDAIRSATPVTDLDGSPSAVFEYSISEDATLNLGLESLKASLPYLYITRRSLGPVRIHVRESYDELWTPSEIKIEQIEGGYVEYRSLAVQRNGTVSPELKVLKFMTVEDASAAAIVLVEHLEGNWIVRFPGTNEPLIYREYPLQGSGFLPISFVFDGKFKPDQERHKLLMDDDDKEILQDAFKAAVVGTKYVSEQKWRNGHWLARANKSSTAFDPINLAERDWWNDQLKTFALKLAKLPIVETTSRFLPAIAEEDDGWFVDFIVPRLLDESGENETTVDRLWPLVEAATELEPPRIELAVDWTRIASGWHELGLELGLVTLRKLADYVKKGAANLDDLKVSGDPLFWLARFFDTVGECWEKRSGVDLNVLTGLTPNQNGRLCSPPELSIDGGISEELKNICREMGYDIRNELLLSDLLRAGEENSLTFLPQMTSRAIDRTISEEDVIERAIKRLNDELTEDKDYKQSKLNVQEASVRLLNYLWVSKGKDSSSVAKRIPLITSSHRAVRWSIDRLMMAPIQCWREASRPFAVAYPPDRVLADIYVASRDQQGDGVIAPLVQWGIAFGDPLTVDIPVELKERRLAAISNEDTDGVVVKGEEFSQIALLQPELLNRCQDGIAEAQALLGLVLCYIAPNDSLWKVERVVKARKARQDVDLNLLTGALWLADLKFRTWVPVTGDDGKVKREAADASTLKNILKAEWLENNDSAIELLSDWFGFDELELRLLGVAPDQDKRQELRDGLAKLVEYGGGDPELYKSLIDDIEARRRRSRDVERCRRLGFAVQDAIKKALEKYDLNVDLVDRGFDYEVSAGATLEDAAMHIEVGSYFLEVKATTSGNARLTPTQAETSSNNPSRYVLCAVDLRGLSEEQLEMDWDATRVEPLAKLVVDIGGKVQSTCKLVTAAKNSSVGIRNDSALRYEVPTSLWESGVSISEWVKRTWNR